MTAFSTVSVSSDFARRLGKLANELTRSEVLVGIPDSTATRKPEPGAKSPASNAVIGYVQEFGDENLHIPPRPFLIPGVENAKEGIVEGLKSAGMGALAGDASHMRRGLEMAGMAAQNAVTQKITDGPFVPISERTIQGRARRGQKGAKDFLKLKSQGVPLDMLMGAEFVRPLLDSGQLRAAITFVIRPKGA